MAKREGSEARRDLVAGQILEQAAAMFAERGFDGTSLQEVADALKVSRTSLYHYIGGKQDLLATLVQGLSGDTAQGLETLLEDSAIEPATKLRLAIEGMAGRIASSPARFRLLLVNERMLTGELAQEHREGRRRTLHALSEIIREGMEAGVLRPGDPRIAAFAVLGICNWIAWWYRPDGTDTPQGIRQLTAALAEIALRGLAESDGRAIPTDHDPATDALDRLREDVDRLQQVLALRKQT